MHHGLTLGQSSLASSGPTITLADGKEIPVSQYEPEDTSVPAVPFLEDDSPVVIEEKPTRRYGGNPRHHNDVIIH